MNYSEKTLRLVSNDSSRRLQPLTGELAESLQSPVKVYINIDYVMAASLFIGKVFTLVII